MISKVDFEDNFPHLFKPEHRAFSEPKQSLRSLECIARWEDDGGAARLISHKGKSPSWSAERVPGMI